MSRLAFVIWIVCSHANAFQLSFLAACKDTSWSQKTRLGFSVRSITDETNSNPSEVPMPSLAHIGNTTSDILRLAEASLKRVRDVTSTTIVLLNHLASGALENQAIARRCKILLADDVKRLKLSVDEVNTFM